MQPLHAKYLSCMHVHETCKLQAYKLQAYKLQAYKLQACKLQAYKLQACKLQAFGVFAGMHLMHAKQFFFIFCMHVPKTRAGNCRVRAGNFRSWILKMQFQANSWYVDTLHAKSKMKMLHAKVEMLHAKSKCCMAILFSAAGIFRLSGYAY